MDHWAYQYRNLLALIFFSKRQIPRISCFTQLAEQGPTCSHTGLEVWQWTSIIFGLHILKKMSFLFNIFLLEEQRLSQNHSYLGHVDLCVFCLICTGTPSLLLLFAASSVVTELSSFLREVSGLYSSGSSILAIVFNKLQKPFMTTCSYPIVSKNNYCV